mmetsp:Transcript_27874/g.28141  ORF Transcript_27874/g.28141 Transcript_27874/m.28141 type:complete len:609 (-) Transcript_27874:70-1896(-)
MAHLKSLRCLMKDLDIAALIVESSDAHQSEFVPECDQRRSFISGFTGSNGTAVICEESALLWTDGRYFIQATQELSSDWTLMRSGNPGIPTMNEWLCSNLNIGDKVGVDAWLISATEAKLLQTKLEKHNIKLLPLESNPIDKIWETESRPSPPFSLVKLQELCYAGQCYTEKIMKIREGLKSKEAMGIVISLLDEIAWLLNIRGADIPYSPVSVSYVIITPNSTHLFINTLKLNDEVQNYFHDNNIICHEYNDIESYLTQLSAQGRILIDPNTINWRLYSLLGDNKQQEKSPITLLKAIKNDTELYGFRQCHIRDGAALTAFLCWLEGMVTGSLQDTTMSLPMTEYKVAGKIEEFRGRDPLHMSPSFGTIAGYGANGAMNHYIPHENTSAVIDTNTLLLLDSGGQYLDGTTDITRTVHFGAPSDRIRFCFTTVLKGHIGLATAIFPEGTPGSQLDIFARGPLWEQGLDYNHGTGHGVGSYLNVHEGPQGIGSRVYKNDAPFKIGMTISNEPGYYEEGEFGIRIENICITVEEKTESNFRDKKYCTFETVSLAPIQKKLIDMNLLNEFELTWLNTYHMKVRETLMPVMIERFPEAIEYLIYETEPLVRE